MSTFQITPNYSNLLEDHKYLLNLFHYLTKCSGRRWYVLSYLVGKWFLFLFLSQGQPTSQFKSYVRFVWTTCLGFTNIITSFMNIYSLCVSCLVPSDSSDALESSEGIYQSLLMYLLIFFLLSMHLHSSKNTFG